MAIRKCPNCGETIITPAYVTDIVHECKSDNEVVDFEDVVKTGTYIDEETGESVEIFNPNLQGLGKQEEGENYLTARGNRRSTHRTRRHYEYIKFWGIKKI